SAGVWARVGGARRTRNRIHTKSVTRSFIDVSEEARPGESGSVVGPRGAFEGIAAARRCKEKATCRPREGANRGSGLRTALFGRLIWSAARHRRVQFDFQKNQSGDASPHSKSTAL